MAINLDSEDFILGVIGAGAMGRGIVQVAAAGGLKVKLFDVNQAQSQDALEFIGKMLGRAADKGQMTEESALAASARIEVIEMTRGLSDCQIVIEAATENPDIKNKIYADLEDIVAEDAIIATNTTRPTASTELENRKPSSLGMSIKIGMP